LLGGDLADAATISELKGQHMGIDSIASLFDAVPAVGATSGGGR
jgi:hypothetical protein